MLSAKETPFMMEELDVGKRKNPVRSMLLAFTVSSKVRVIVSAVKFRLKPNNTGPTVSALYSLA